MSLSSMTAHEPPRTADEIDRLTTLYLASARGWVDSRCPPLPADVTPLAYRPGGPNIVVTDSATTVGLVATMDWVAATKDPAIVFVTGAALANVQVLADAGWVCTGAQPLMRRPARRSPPARSAASDVRDVAAAADIAEMRRLLAEVFTAAGGIPEPADGVVARNWGLFGDLGLLSCAISARIDNTVAVWGVATWPDLQHHGFASRLMESIHATFEDTRVAREFLLLSTDAGLRLYRSLGYRPVAWWQGWSRPRWCFGRA